MRPQSVPLWRRPGWLPELEHLDWPRLTKLRSEHERLVKAHTAFLSDLAVVQAKFATEDAKVLSAERAAEAAEIEAVRTGVEPPSEATAIPPITPARRRRARLHVVKEAADEALDELTRHVARIVDELSAHWGETHQIWATESGLVATEPPEWDLSQLDASDIEAHNERAERFNRQRRLKAEETRRRLRSDEEALDRLWSRVVGEAPNTRVEIAQARTEAGLGSLPGLEVLPGMMQSIAPTRSA